MSKIKILLVAALVLVATACQYPHTDPTPVPNPNPPVVTPPPITPTPDQPDVVTPPYNPPPQQTSNAIDRDMYAAVNAGMTVDQMKAVVGTTPTAIPPVRQPDGGLLYRYRILDSDGQWRNRHANFITDRNGVIKRKSIS